MRNTEDRSLEQWQPLQDHPRLGTQGVAATACHCSLVPPVGSVLIQAPDSKRGSSLGWPPEAERCTISIQPREATAHNDPTTAEYALDQTADVEQRRGGGRCIMAASEAIDCRRRTLC